MPVTTVGEGKLVPPSVGPETVHGIGDFYERKIFIQPQIGIIRTACLGKGWVFSPIAIYVVHAVVNSYKCSGEIFSVFFSLKKSYNIQKGKFPIVQGNKIHVVKDRGF